MTTAPKRRWFRWSLRTLLVVVTFFGIAVGFGCGWIAGRAYLRHQQEALWAEEENPFDETAVPRNPVQKDLAKDYLGFPEEQDYQHPTPSGVFK